LLQKETQMYEIGDPALLLDENFDLSPKNYSKLLEYMKKTALRLNQVVSQSSDLFSNYLGLNDISEHLKHESLPNLVHTQSYQSVDSNSTRDSDPSFSEEKCKDFHSHQPSWKQKAKMSQIWESENDTIIIKLAKKYHKDWNQVSRAFSETYSLNYKPEFLKARYTQLIKQETLVNSTRKNIQNLEDFTNKESNYHERNKKVKVETYKEEPYSPSSGSFDQFLPYEANHMNYHIKDNDGESFKLFFTKNEQLESKILELPWITLDMNREFDQDNELFERVTSCHN